MLVTSRRGPTNHRGHTLLLMSSSIMAGTDNSNTDRTGNSHTQIESFNKSMDVGDTALVLAFCLSAVHTAGGSGSTTSCEYLQQICESEHLLPEPVAIDLNDVRDFSVPL